RRTAMQSSARTNPCSAIRIVSSQVRPTESPRPQACRPPPVTSAAHQAVATTQPEADEVVRNGAGRALRYTARAGDNVSKLAAVLLGSDTQANRDAIISNNASLKSNPDRVVAGQTYWIPAPAAPTEKP